MLNKIKYIKNFKSIKNLKDVELGQITVISGKNNVGKTNLLEALFLLHDRYNVGSVIRLWTLRDLRNFPIKTENIASLLFYDQDMNQSIEICLNSNNLTESLKIKYNPSLIEKSQAVKEFSKNDEIIDLTSSNAVFKPALEVEYELSGKNKEKFNLVMNDDSFDFKRETTINTQVSPLKIVNSLNCKTGKDDAIRFGEIDIKGKAEEVIEALKIIDNRIKSITSVETGSGSVLYADVGLNTKLPLNFVGDGITRLFKIILSIMINKDGIVLIDEIENGFHYSIYEEVFKVISKVAVKNNCQVIATTHNKEFLEKISNGIEEYKDKFKFIRMEYNKNNELVTKIFDHEMLRTAVEYDMEVR